MVPIKIESLIHVTEEAVRESMKQKSWHEGMEIMTSMKDIFVTGCQNANYILGTVDFLRDFEVVPMGQEREVFAKAVFFDGRGKELDSYQSVMFQHPATKELYYIVVIKPGSNVVLQLKETNQSLMRVEIDADSKIAAFIGINPVWHSDDKIDIVMLGRFFNFKIDGRSHGAWVPSSRRPNLFQSSQDLLS